MTDRDKAIERVIEESRRIARVFFFSGGIKPLVDALSQLDAAQVDNVQPISLKDFPLGTKAPATGGGWWTKVRHGWKWMSGDTFPAPGGDWNQTLILPDDAAQPPASDVCECGHGKDSHITDDCYYDGCECPQYRPRVEQKGSD